MPLGDGWDSQSSAGSGFYSSTCGGLSRRVEDSGKWEDSLARLTREGMKSSCGDLVGMEEFTERARGKRGGGGVVTNNQGEEQGITHLK